MEPLISIIIPIYKVEDYLDRCMQSVLRQSYTNLEIIIVDDGSPDNCPAMCESYQKKDARIKVIHKENGGLSDARNAGIDIAQGQYIAFIDSDDWVSENYIQIMHQKMKEYQCDISIIDTVESDGTRQSEKSYNAGRVSDKVYSAEEAMQVIFSQREFNTSAWGKLYKRELFLNKRFTKGILYEDLDLIYQLFEMAEKICFSDDAKYYYFQRKDSIAHGSFDRKHMVLLDISQKILEYTDQKHPAIHDAAVARYVFSNLLILSKIIQDKNYIEEQRTIRKDILQLGKQVYYNPDIERNQKIKVRILTLGLGIYRYLFTKKNRNK